MQIYWTRINKIIDETPEVKTYMLDRPEGFAWEEGAHTHFALTGFNAGSQRNRGLIRHMSIATLPREGSIGITTRIKTQCSDFKNILRDCAAGTEVAFFKTHSNVPLRRQGKNIYLFSQGVGLATLRPLVLEYLKSAAGVGRMHSLNVDAANDDVSRCFLFPEVFAPAADKNFSAQSVDNRSDYYAAAAALAEDTDGLFYVVGSYDFVVQNVRFLHRQGIELEQLMLDMHEQQRARLIRDAMGGQAAAPAVVAAG